MPLSPLYRSTLGLTAVAACLTAGPHALTTAAAQEKAAEAETRAGDNRSYDIPAGPLSEVLSRFAGQSGLLLSSDAELTAGKRSEGLEGRYTVRQALTELLDGKGLDYEISGGNTVTLKAPTDEDPGQLAPITVEAVPQLSTYGRNDDYRVDSSTFALGGTDALLQETPFSVSVVDEDLINDVDPDQLDNIADYTAGVQRGNQVNNTSQAFQSRGFQLGRDSILINGVQQSDAFSVIPTEFLTAVEFLRGPSSVLNGQAPPGGAANLVTKKPQPEAFTRVTLTGDQHQEHKLAVDYNSGEFRLGSVPTAFRLNIVGEDSETFRDEVEREVGGIAPVATFDLTPDTRLTLEAQLIDREATDDRGLPLFGADSDDAAEARFDQDDFILGTTDKQNDREQTRFMVDLSHEFNEHLTSSFQINYDRTERSFFAVLPRQINPANGNLVRTQFGTRDKFEAIDARADTTFEFDTGALNHSGVVALQWRDFERRDEFTGFATDQVDIDDPQPDKAFTGIGPGRGLEGDQQSRELFLQDRVSLTRGPLQGLFVIAGGRFIAFEDQLDSQRDQDETTFRFGGGYTPPQAPWLTVYANYSESFNPQSGTTAGGQALRPAEGSQIEAGTKLSLFEDRLLLTAAAFEVENENVGVDDPNAPSGQIAVGKQTNQGVELEAIGGLTDNLQLRAQYTYNDSEIEDDPQRTGNELQLTPDHSASAWLRHDAVSVPGIDEQRLTLAGGVVHVGDRFVSVDNNIELSSYTRADLKAAYDFAQGTELELNIRNVTDEEYFVGGDAFGLGSVLPGQTRTFSLELSHTF